MAIEFHCEHCNKSIKAPDEAAGRQGKCPHCGGLNYIRRPPEETEELDLTPLDDQEEKRRKRQAEEDAAVQWRLLHERTMPGEPGGRGAGGRGSATPPPSPSSKQLAALIVKYIDAMSQGKLDQAEEVAGQLERNRSHTLGLLDEMAAEDLSAYGLPTLPRPVLLGFLKQLRARL